MYMIYKSMSYIYNLTLCETLLFRFPVDTVKIKPWSKMTGLSFCYLHMSSIPFQVSTHSYGLQLEHIALQLEAE